MNVHYTCRQCEQPVQLEVPGLLSSLTCPHCGDAMPIGQDDFEGEKLQACLVCGCRELFVRKDFSQRMGVGIVLVGFLFSTIAWGFHLRYVSYAILFATAMIDVVLYLTVQSMVQCYRCHAEYRQSPPSTDFGPFDLTTHERFRQQSLRMSQGKKG